MTLVPISRFAPFLALALSFGCAGPGARLFPIAPLREARDGEGLLRRLYDTDADGKTDCAEVLGVDGRVKAIFGAGAAEGPLAFGPSAATRELLIILDSIPYEMVRDAWNAGRFRFFHPPARVVSVFPAMTDPAISEFFGVSPCIAVESVYYDGAKLNSGFDAYVEGENSPWRSSVDWRLDSNEHAWAYLWPGMWYRYELGEIQREFERRADTGKNAPFRAYVMGTSALGSQRGRDGHQQALVEVDRLCQQIMFDSHGRVRITLMSDHGHHLMQNRRVDLVQALGRCGYNPTDRLRAPSDVIVPEFGLVSCAAVYTRSPASVARDLVGIEGVELTCYMHREFHPDSSAEGGVRAVERMIVVSRDGEATIQCSARGYRYETLRGDPLRLGVVFSQLRESGHVDDAGFASDRALFDATVEHEYPDALHRLWRAFHGLFEHPPDVYVSLADGWFAGSLELTKWLDMAAVHGNLNQRGTCGFVMTTAGPLPPALRMEDVRAALEAAK